MFSLISCYDYCNILAIMNICYCFITNLLQNNNYNRRCILLLLNCNFLQHKQISCECCKKHSTFLKLICKKKYIKNMWQKVSGMWPYAHHCPLIIWDVMGMFSSRPSAVPVYQRSPVREAASDRVKRRVLFNVNELIHILFNTWSATSSSGSVPFWNPKRFIIRIHSLLKPKASSLICNLQSSPTISITQ